MPREIASHKASPLDNALAVFAMDEPGLGGANHAYSIKVNDQWVADLGFQNGPINEVGVNGISNEALLAIVEDRLKGFQSDKFACRENAIALTHIQDALMWLQRRTRERIARGVEGTHNV